MIADWGWLVLLLGQCGGQLFEQLLLFLGQLPRRADPHRHQQITTPTSADIRQPVAANAERRSGLRARGNREWFVAVERGDANLSPERQRREVQRHLAVEIVAVALKELVLLHVDDDVEVAGRASTRSRFAFITQT